MNITAFLKIFGLVLASFVGLFAVVIGYLFATGGFNPPYIPPTSIAFEFNEYVIDEDTEIFIFPTPENATELDIELRIITGNSIIAVPDTAKMGEPILIEVLKNEYDKNIGGVARVRASQGGLLLAETKILVDVPVESFTIHSSNPNNLYVGNTFTVSPANLYPANSLNPSSSALPKPNKVIRYYSSHPAVATVNELTGQVTTVGEGTFTIEARVIKTYNFIATQPNPLDFEYEEDYWAEMDEISTVITRQFTVSSIAVAGIEANDNQDNPLYDLYLHQTYIFTPSSFNLRLLPQPDSSFTPAQLSYKLKDLIIWVSNDNVLEVTQLEDPLRYQIRVLNYETWQIQRTRMTFTYEDEFNIFEATVHFKILRNEVIDIAITKNTPAAIEVLLKPVNPETYNLVQKTTITAETNLVAPTYTKLLYKVDLDQAKNDLDQYIISINTLNGYVTDNIITPLNRGTTRLKAFIIQTDINNEPVLDQFGNYIIMFEMPEYVTVNVLEQLTEIVPVTFKKPKTIGINVGETLQIKLTNLTPQQVADYNLGKIEFVTNENMLQLISYELQDNTLTANYLALQTGTVNVFITNNDTKMFIDYVEVGIASEEASLEPVPYPFNLNKTLEVLPPSTPQNPDPAPIISMIRGTEAFLTFDPNSYGAFVDAYRYGKLIFESTNTNMIQIYTSIDANNNIIVKLVAVGFSLNPENSFSMIRIRLSAAAPNIFLLNEKVYIDLGAVNGIHLSVNSNNIQAIPEVGGTQWRTPEGEILTPIVTFANPDEPAITGVQFISSDTSILQIDETIINEKGIPNFIFKKAGTVTLTIKSLDEYAKPTDPNNPQLGAYSFVILNVTTPPVLTEFRYTNSVDETINNFTKMLAGEQIDLLAKEILVAAQLKARIEIKSNNDVDYTPLAKFQLIGIQGAATLTEYPENVTMGIPRRLILQTNEIGVSVTVQIRVYTDFGFEAFYNVQIIPDIVSTITYKGGSSPEIVYPLIQADTQKEIRLLDMQEGIRRVLITKRDGSAINNLQFELSHTNSINLSPHEVGVIYVWQTDVDREVEIRIFIQFASGINFETYYYITIRPNFDIQLDYTNAVVYGAHLYKEINYASSYDLVSNGKVAAYTIDPEGQNITNIMNYALLDSNPYISISQAGVLTIATIPQDQYITIRVYEPVTGYYADYRIKIKA